MAVYAVAGGAAAAAGAASSAAAPAPGWRRQRVAPRARVIPHAVATDIGAELWVEEFTVDGAGSISANVYEGADAYTILIHMDGESSPSPTHATMSRVLRWRGRGASVSLTSQRRQGYVRPKTQVRLRQT